MFKRKFKTYVFNVCLLLQLMVIISSCYVQSRFSGEQILIELERTRCYGNCPVYLTKINEKGYVLYEGRENVNNTGLFKARIPDAALHNLIQEFERADFFNLKDNYIATISDLPSTYIHFQYNGKSKRILDYYGAPQELKDLENKIDEIVGGLKMKKIKK